MEEEFTILFIFFVILFAVVIIVTAICATIEAINVATNKSVVTEEVVAVKVIRLDIASDDGKTRYFVTVKGEEISEVFRISKTEFANLQEGDKISVKIKYTENSKLPDEREITIVED